MRRRMVIGNWKMNGVPDDLTAIDEVERGLHPDCGVDVGVCPPATLLMAAARKARLLRIGGQDCHRAVEGAHTGSISANMLRSVGASLVILGHSERRQGLGEGDGDVASKAAAAMAAGLLVVLCVGETVTTRMSGQAIATVVEQLAASLPPHVSSDGMVVAYEPIWAIGSGKIPSSDEIAEMHRALRRHLCSTIDPGASVRLLYGGSVTPSNADRLMQIENVDGVLVGGASLRSEQFLAIVEAARGLAILA